MKAYEIPTWANYAGYSEARRDAADREACRAGELGPIVRALYGSAWFPMNDAEQVECSRSTTPEPNRAIRRDRFDARNTCSLID